MVNRKLIRPNLAEVKERFSTRPQSDGQAQGASHGHGSHARREQGNGSAGQAARRRVAPPEQTNAEAFYYLKQMNSATPMVIVLDDDVNTFQHVVNCLRRIIPGVSEEKAWDLANRIDGQGSAEVWCGPLEQAELYHHQLMAEGLTMAPLERC